MEDSARNDMQKGLLIALALSISKNEKTIFEIDASKKKAKNTIEAIPLGVVKSFSMIRLVYSIILCLISKE